MSIRILFKKRTKSFFSFFVFMFLLYGQSAFTQKIDVSGTVFDDAGLVLPGVNVFEKGTKNAVSTDLDGKFKIQVSSTKSVLVFSYLGFQEFSQVVDNKKTLSIVLKSTANTLEEVVIGFGTRKKSDLTGSVSVVSGDDLKKISMPSVAETLTGRIAGVRVTSAEGAPDSEINIRIRGGGSLTQDAAPLYIVDGFPVNSINDVSPSDIDNLTVLKDASSTAIYGSRGANGVIIITTKKGSKGGKISVSYNSFYGNKKIANTIDVLGAQDYSNWQYEYALLNNILPSYVSAFGAWQPDNYTNVPTTNWQKEIYGRTGTSQSNDLGIRGGTEKVNYNFNFTRYNEKAIMLGSDFTRNNISLNLKNKASDKIDLSFTLRYSDTEIRGGGANERNEVSSSDSRLRHVVGYAPISLTGVTTDNTDEAISNYLVNPFVAVADNDRLQTRKNYNLLGGISWNLAKNLDLKSDFGFDNYFYSDNRFYGRSTYYVDNIPLAENQGLSALVTSDRVDTKYRFANTLNYDFKDLLSSKHKLKLLVGQETINYKSTTKTETIHALPKLFDFEDAMNLTSQGKPQSVNNFVNPDDKLVSFFGRVNYDINNKYLFTATYRADGSSKFLGNNKWGFFPSAAAAWKISEEDFLKNVSWVKALKLRVSYGEAGNNNIPTGQTLQTFQSTSSAWINGVTNYWSAAKVLANPNLKWETTITQNIGLDYDLFGGRVNGTVEVYKNLTQDLLVRFPVPGTGYDYQFRNVGEIQNSGIEASLNLIALDKKDYGLSFGFNVSFNKNRINSLGELANFGQATNWASTAIGNDFVVNVGEPIGLMYGYQNDGRYEVSDFNYSGGVYTLKTGIPNASSVVGTVVPGSMKLKDINGDGVVNIQDQTVIGNANPKHTGGFVINANLKSFDLSAAFNYSYGNDIYNADKIEYTTSNVNGQYRNLSTQAAGGVRWTNINAAGQLVTDPTELAALNANTTLWSPNMTRYVFSDWAVEDGSFLRLNTLTLGYSLPKSLIDKLGVSKFRFYLTGNNIFVLTKYSGLDPEVSTRRDTPLTPGVDSSPYPRSRQFVFGLNLNF